MPNIPQPNESVERVWNEIEYAMKNQECTCGENIREKIFHNHVPQEYINKTKEFLVPFFDRALTQARLDTLEEVLRGMPEEWTQIKVLTNGDPRCEGFNACRAAVIKMIEGLRKEGV